MWLVLARVSKVMLVEGGMLIGSLSANSLVGMSGEGEQQAGSAGFSCMLCYEQSLGRARRDGFSCPSLSSMCCTV